MSAIHNWSKSDSRSRRPPTFIRVTLQSTGMTFEALARPPEEVYLTFRKQAVGQELSVYLDEEAAKLAFAALRDFLERRQAARIVRQPNPLDDADRIHMKLIPERK